MRKLFLVLAVLALALPGLAQTRAQLKSELKTMEASAKDADGLVEVAKWAKEKGLLTDHKRILNKVLKKDPEHEGAKVMLGFVRYKGEWMEKTKAEILERREEEATYKAKGMAQVDGVWVTEAEVADAKKGLFHHDGESVSRKDKIALMSGQVRHAVTGQFIAKEDEEKANQGLYPVSEGRWVKAAEANEYHANPQRPWVMRTFYTTILTTLPIEKFPDVKAHVDDAFEFIKPLFAGRLPHPGHRPQIIVCGTTDEFKQVGAAIGAERSAYGAFLAQGEPTLEGIEFPVLPAVANFGEKDWGQYYIKHAAGLAYVSALCAEVEAEIPYWITCGVGALPERHATPGLTKFFGEQHIAKGGVTDLKAWFSDFEISPDLEPKKIAYNVFQAGLVLTFCMRGGDDKATEALQALTAAFDKNGKAVAKAAQKLEGVMNGKTDAVRDYLRDCIRKG